MTDDTQQPRQFEAVYLFIPTADRSSPGGETCRASLFLFTTGGFEMTEGAAEAGKVMYFFTHAYHHVIAEIVEMLGQQRARVKNVRWVYSCRRNWTDFFADGAKEDTTYHKYPPGEISWFNCFDWNHQIPGGKDKK